MAIAARPAAAETTSWTSDPQQDVASYDIAVSLDPSSMQLHGTERITYRNPSPDALDEVWLHLYLNAFQSRATLWMREAANSFRGSTYDPTHPGWEHLESLALDGVEEPIPAGDDADGTMARVLLPRPLAPGGTLSMDVRWTSQLPRVFARTGFADDFVMAGQWYPKLSVYDRGAWDTEPWHANAEFFADFGHYDLALTVPADAITGASGVRQSESLQGDGTKTVRYHADRVTDVAWTAWRGFAVLDDVANVGGAHVQLELLVPPGERDAAERHLGVARAALDAYGTWYGPYPWPKLTIVVPPPGGQGAGGMEYPTLVTTGAGQRLPFGLDRGIHDVELITAHEIAHQWFPMQVRTNEASEAWLDEGFAEYLTVRVLSRPYGEDRSVLDLPGARLGYAEVQRAIFTSARVAREPLDQTAWAFSSQGRYAGTVYGKGSLALLSLERTLGNERFTAALHAYADRWRWRHPRAIDLQGALQDATGEPLGWFFDQFVTGSRVVDYRVANLETTRATVERLGDARYPVEVHLAFADGGPERVEQWDGSGDRLGLDGGGRPIAGVSVDSEDKVPLRLERLADARVARADDTGAAQVAASWLALGQALLQLVGQLG